MRRITVASIAALAALLATAIPNWIELLARFDPDAQDGSAELLIAAGLLALAGLSFALAAKRRRYARSFISKLAPD